MLRSTRPIISGSARGVASHRGVASFSTFRQVQHNASSSRLGDITHRRRGLQILGNLKQTSQYVTKSPGGMQAGIDREEEKKFAQQKLESHPSEVTSESSVRKSVEFNPIESSHRTDMGKDIKDELQTVKSTFALSEVPREPYALGLAGTMPYLATSISTVYLSWDLNTQWPTGSSFKDAILMNHEQAHQWLSLIEPIQLGYGAIIISFLGAIHWGLEYAEKSTDPKRTRFRYAMGVVAPMMAWPTLLMPMEFALTAQFAAFVGLYYADTRASVRGWAPTWYGTYRWVLTAVVGLSIIISLIGRAKVGDAQPRLTGLDEKIQTQTMGEQPYDEKWAKLEAEDKARMQKEKEAAERKKKQEEQKKAQEEKAQKAQGGKKEEEKNEASEKKQENEKKDDGDKKDEGEKKAEGEKESESEKKDEGEKKEKEADKEGGKAEEKKDDDKKAEEKKDEKKD